MDDVKHLRNLNDAQLAAVTFVPTTPLQILAGPGSGKTKTLICRIAHLISHHKIHPSRIVAVTFTNKAANELRNRLDGLIGKAEASSVVLGTFHAICARLLRQHGSEINLPRNFSICDADEVKKIINGILKDMVAAAGLHGSNKRIEVRDSVAVEYISKAKSKGLSPDDLETKAQRDIASKESLPKGEADPQFMLQVSSIYAEYMKVCKNNNALDFDDLLTYGVKLLQTKPSCIDYEHVFVDEFQDTNTTQLQLMKHFAARHGNVSIVGDPDQSIYGWRSAEIENLTRMIKLFPGTKQVFLEDNYRSTGAILAASLAIISEDTTRPPKTLRTSHPYGVTVTIGNCADEHEEAVCIAEEIKRLKLISGGLLKWSDFAILLRFNALSRNLETALQKMGIPNRILSGQKFFERVEVKDLLAYLQLIDNPNFDPAALRVLNVPKRNIGNKSVEELRKRASKTGKPVMHTVEKIVDGRIPDISPPLRSKAREFIQTMRDLRQKAIKGISVASLIRELLMQLDYAEHLKKTQPDWESRWENVRELITFATESSTAQVSSQSNSVQDDDSSSTDAADVTRATTTASLLKEDKQAGLVDGDLWEDTSPLPGEDSSLSDELESTNPLRVFLETTSLSTDVVANDEDAENEKVIISTCHAAKGLEWPVVFIPSVERGTYPFYRSEDTEEERRLLYVACTRAQVLLYLTHAARRKLGGDSKEAELSEFLTVVMKKNKNLFTSNKPILGHKEFSLLSKVLGRPAPEATAVQQGVQEYYKVQATSTAPAANTGGVLPQPAPNGYSQGQSTNRTFKFKNMSTEQTQHSQGAMPAVFTTARSVVGSLPPVQITPSNKVSKPIAAPSTQTLQTMWATTSTTVSRVNPTIGSGYTPGNASVASVSSHHQIRAGTAASARPSHAAVASSQPIQAPRGQFSFSSAASSLSQPSTSSSTSQTASSSEPPAKVAGTKRRLGMSARGPEFPRKK
ncbi:hypothetical protein M408DRAFT_24487 [Serendipita vermifera MAFF 305830]|uniref:DNA 3'-5' helicase n=1 Tax=Serendipita vermifera MAFF 305830 TaxID=933852 RepID=A0A0C3ASN3_SERVB|nr:hypothetical protein M408DRAFT_24487 [Serendipita vermifera MAFF 305830]